MVARQYFGLWSMYQGWEFLYHSGLVEQHGSSSYCFATGPGSPARWCRKHWEGVLPGGEEDITKRHSAFILSLPVISWSCGENVRNCFNALRIPVVVPNKVLQLRINWNTLKPITDIGRYIKDIMLDLCLFRVKTSYSRTAEQKTAKRARWANRERKKDAQKRREEDDEGEGNNQSVDPWWSYQSTSYRSESPWWTRKKS